MRDTSFGHDLKIAIGLQHPQGGGVSRGQILRSMLLDRRRLGSLFGAAVARDRETGEAQNVIVMAVRVEHVIDLGRSHLQCLHADGDVGPDVHEDVIVDDETCGLLTATEPSPADPDKSHFQYDVDGSFGTSLWSGAPDQFETGVTPFVRMIFPYFAVSPVMTTA